MSSMLPADAMKASCSRADDSDEVVRRRARRPGVLGHQLPDDPFVMSLEPRDGVELMLEHQRPLRVSECERGHDGDERTERPERQIRARVGV